MSEQKVVPRSKKMNVIFLFAKNNLEDVLFNTPELTWLTNDGISDSMSFYPNQIKVLISNYNRKFYFY